MRNGFLAGLLALVGVLLPSAAFADDPNDPAMRHAEERARDRAIIKRLNEEQLAYVKERDARYAKGWQDYRDAPRSRDQYDKAQDDYARELAEWRRAVAECRAGNYRYCER